MLWKYNCEEWKYGILQQAASAADLLNPGSTFRPHRRRIIDNLTRRKASFQTLDKYNLTLYQAKIYISLDYQILNWIFVHKATKAIMINVQINDIWWPCSKVNKSVHLIALKMPSIKQAKSFKSGVRKKRKSPFDGFKIWNRKR